APCEPAGPFPIRKGLLCLRFSSRRVMMKVLIGSTPATGHLNPLLAIGHSLIEEGHEVVFLSGSVLRERIEAIGAEFFPFPAGADLDLRNFDAIVPELKEITPGPRWLRVVMERIFVDTIPAQHAGIQQVLRDFPADVLIGDDMLFGVLPMLLGPSSKRPPVVLCGTSILHCRREDGAPLFLGLPPATSAAQRAEYADIARDYDRIVNDPVAPRLNKILRGLGVGTLSMPLFESVVALADAYMQLSVPSFEFPRDLPPSVHFVGTPAIIPNQAPRPRWAADLDGAREVVLVTQGTVANHDFGLLVAPTLAALANEPDLLIVVTTGGRPLDTIPGRIPSNARLATYLPFEWVLPKADVLVTNGGYGSGNPGVSLGNSIRPTGVPPDNAGVKARNRRCGVRNEYAHQQPTPDALRDGVRAVLDRPSYGARASAMADEFAKLDTRSEMLRIIRNISR